MKNGVETLEFEGNERTSHTDKGSVMSERYVIDEEGDNKKKSERRIFGSIRFGCAIGPSGCGGVTTRM